MNQEINRINRELPDTDADEKTDFIRQCIRLVYGRLELFKAAHSRLLKEHMTQLELAIWKAKLDEMDDNSSPKGQTKRVEVNDCTRVEKRITSGADIIIKNVIPFLKLA